MSTPEIEIRRSSRRRTTAKAYADRGRIVVEVPSHLPEDVAEETAAKLVARLRSRETHLRDDEDLAARAREVADRYLDHLVDGGISPFTIRWVGNQRQRWGSCTPSTRTIRISQRVRTMPDYVLDYVLVHELSHLAERTHGERFRLLESAYPHAERAKGYLEGYTAGAGWEPADG
ncbi:M48 family metallopeptidase [Propionicicella superfundia]|uniref:M48 metallopeptidase family protein n=1 Tax=Propionicicella superfundia TaxID=348582 RepID=UPI0004030E74|nr:M48 family metallopeptidase [Propionicicella superfundia]